MEKDYSNLHRKLVLKYFWQVVKNFKTAFFTVIFLTILSGIIDVYIPLQFLKLWNVLSSNDFSFLPKARSILIFILALGALRWIVKRSAGMVNSYFQANVLEGLRKQGFAYMIGHSRTFFANNFSGSLTRKISKYANAFEKIMDRTVNDGLPLLTRAVGTVFAIYSLVPKYAYILAIFCFVFLLTALIYTRWKIKYDVLAAESDTKTTGVLSDSISNHTTIQFFASEKFETSRVGEVLRDQKKATLINWYLWETLGAIQSLYSFVIEFIVLWIAISDWRIGLVTLPVIVLTQNYLVRLIENLWSFAAIIRTYFDSFADAQEMALVLDAPYEIKDSIEEKIEKAKGEIIFENVTYVYNKNNTKVFDNFSLVIPPGQKIAIIGSSGAGKSTFTSLLMRLFNLNEGRILIDGIDISKVSQKNLRDQISFVPQDTSLFHRTLMDNIRYGKKDATDDEVRNASNLAHCDNFIKNLPKGFDTYVGERGIKLSGGERQRVAIARAILKNAPILILDEATSALDSESEILIHDALKSLIKNKTAVVIAHRLSTVREMDRILVISGGKIIEDGNHETLIKKENGAYKKLWDIQAGGFKKLI